MAFIDITGQKFNHWTVLKREKNNSNGDAMWLCECDCENHTQKIVKGSSLRRGHSKSCGCIKKEIAKELGHKNSADLVGQTFGKLLVLEKAYSKNYKSFWKCQCSCEDQNIVYVPTDKLKSGHTASCGCLVSSNLIGKKFGKLTVIAKSDKQTSNKTNIWECKCSCLNESIVFVNTSALIKGYITHCGCESKNMSAGESKIKIILDENNIPYQKEKIFYDFKYEDTNQFPRFDFFVNNSYIIEFDGEQHFQYRKNGFFTKENFINIQKKDQIKNEWCFKNNIPIIRIPYYKLKDLELKDLLLDTSEYVLKKI